MRHVTSIQKSSLPSGVLSRFDFACKIHESMRLVSTTAAYVNAVFKIVNSIVVSQKAAEATTDCTPS